MSIAPKFGPKSKIILSKSKLKIFCVRSWVCVFGNGNFQKSGRVLRFGVILVIFGGCGGLKGGFFGEYFGKSRFFF